MSAAAKFTPGPWLVHGANGNVVYAPDGWIADVKAGTKGSHGPGAQANARLIAAAPELLAAAKRALTTFKAQGECVRAGNVLGALTAAIAKAEGASS